MVFSWPKLDVFRTNDIDSLHRWIIQSRAPKSSIGAARIGTSLQQACTNRFYLFSNISSAGCLRYALGRKQSLYPAIPKGCSKCTPSQKPVGCEQYRTAQVRVGETAMGLTLLLGLLVYLCLTLRVEKAFCSPIHLTVLYGVILCRRRKYKKGLSAKGARTWRLRARASWIAACSHSSRSNAPLPVLHSRRLPPIPCHPCQVHKH